ncbi:MAG: carboxypeptidase-like regulatory domain-containing protein [Saprospiraceae bacterium]
MKNTLTSFLIISLCIIFFTNCRKDEGLTTTKNQFELPQKEVTASIMGRVLNEQGEVLENVLITLNNETTTCDRNGVFNFQNKKINSYGAVLSFEKEGYFTVQKLVRTDEGEKAYLEVMLMQRLLTASFQANQGATIQTLNGAKVKIPANAIQTNLGSNYNGTVSVYARWLNPTAPNLVLEMPGDLRGISEQEELVQLATYGMIGVELIGESGEELQLNGSQKASIEMPIPTDLLANAPNTIPLWHFDEQTAHWLEEGTASLQGNTYVGEVGHFSFWNCDFPFESVFLKGLVLNEDTGLGMPNQRIEIKIDTESRVGIGFTNAAGYFSGAVPKGEVLHISVKDVFCGTTYGITVGPFTTDPNLSVLLTIPTNGLDYLHVTGSLVDCNENPLVDGYVKIVNDNNSLGSIFSTDDNGNFAGDFIFCTNIPTSISVKGIDFNAALESEVTSYSIVTGQTDLDISTIEVCEEFDSKFFYYQIEGGETHFITSAFALMTVTIPGTPPNLFVSVNGPAGTVSPYLIIEDPALGINAVSNMRLVNTSNSLLVCNPCENLVATVLEFGEESGDLIKGSFSGTVDDNGVPVAVSGKFRVNL